MIDSEVARLRRLRSEALLMREIARTFQSTEWAANESLLDRSGCVGWRIARVVSGRLRGHPYAEYQKDAGVATRMAHRIHSGCLVLANKNRADGLKTIASHVNALGRQLDDAIALAWSSDFSDALVRAQSEVKMLGAALAPETVSGSEQERPALRPAFSQQMGDDLGATLEGDWPYLAF